MLVPEQENFKSLVKNNSWNVFGTEPDNDARNLAAEKGIVLEEDVSKFSNQKFEIITLWHVLEHVENLPEFISNLNNMPFRFRKIDHCGT